jgi:hypothetical protein
MLANVSAVMTTSHAGESPERLNQPVLPVLCQGSSPVHSNALPIVRNKTCNICINVTLRHVHEILVAMEKQEVLYTLSVCL